MAAYPDVSRSAETGNQYDTASGPPASHPSGNHHQGHSKQTSFPQLSRKFVARRISEGETGRLKEELKCQACGKGYKHVSSLAKHLWEHTPEWNVTSKLLISKHQQVQLLEAASILVSMNDEDKPSDGSDDDKDMGPAEFEARIREALSRRDRAKKDPKGAHDQMDVAERAPSLEASSGSGRPSTEPVSEPMPNNVPNNVPGTVPEAVPESVREALDSVAEIRAASSASQAVPIAASTAVDDSAIDELTPARDIPILSAKPIAKTPRHSHRRLSTNAGSLGGLGFSSLGTSMGRTDREREMMLRQASPLPESVLAKDHAHHPPHRRRRQSTLMAASMPRETSLDLDEDGLQDPDASPDNDAPNTPKESPGHSPRKNTGADDVFGLEV